MLSMHSLPTRMLACSALIMLLAACGAESITDNSVSNNDRDSDGIIDSIDKCPDTLAGEIPGSDGCVYIEVAMANNILVGGAGSSRPGYTLYVFDDDQGTTGSSCNDSCADTWPPLLVSDGFASGIPKLTTVTRDDGLAQAA
ncbi:MAG: hypothetical protein KJO03_04510, partial [Gammaproteobacteria bacterium]|nr:hypothetical protein [Gammaproteobacteria bacterium]